MTLQERLRTIAEALPDGASITLSSEVLYRLLETDADEGTLPHDLTAEEVADLLDRSPQTVRRWIREGELDAFSFRGREYHITGAALQEFIAREQMAAERAPESPRVRVTKQLGAWRSVYGVTDSRMPQRKPQRCPRTARTSGGSTTNPELPHWL